MPEIAPRLRPKLALWMWERGLKLRDAVAPLGVSYEAARCYCLPFGHPDRYVPSDDVLARIIVWTGGEVTAADFYPPELNGQAGFATAVERAAQ